MSCTEAGRLTGFDPDVFINAVKDGRLRGERGQFVTKTRGAHPAYVVTVGDINRFLDSRPQRSQRGDYSKVIRLLMLLGARFGEIARLRWSDLECDCADCRKRRRKFAFRFLHIPTLLPEGTKPKDLVLYLPQPALDIIDSVPRHGD
jgi:integrase